MPPREQPGRLVSIGAALAAAREKTCVGCESRPIRKTGEPETMVEHISEQLIYCQHCIDAWDDGAPD